MHLVPIQVETYSGFKADESPRRFLLEGQWIEIVEVLDRWHQGHPDPEWPLADYFKVVDPAARQYLIKHDFESDAWHLAKRF
jgi:hypothetical protein